MTAKLAATSPQLLELPFEERLYLAQKLWESVADFIEPGIEEAWMAVADRRWQEIKAGAVQCTPADQVFAKARASLKR